MDTGEQVYNIFEVFGRRGQEIGGTEYYMTYDIDNKINIQYKIQVYSCGF